MSFWSKVKAALVRFMQGRHGPDRMSMHLFYAGLILYLISVFLTRISAWFMILYYVAMVIEIYAIFRMFSRNNERRRNELEKYEQFLVRLKNSKKFKYFKCPNCKARLKLPRKVGKVKMTCGKCGHVFDAKA